MNRFTCVTHPEPDRDVRRDCPEGIEESSDCAEQGPCRHDINPQTDGQKDDVHTWRNRGSKVGVNSVQSDDSHDTEPQEPSQTLGLKKLCRCR